jgi:hypothetical protein
VRPALCQKNDGAGRCHRSLELRERKERARYGGRAPRS